MSTQFQNITDLIERLEDAAMFITYQGATPEKEAALNAARQALLDGIFAQPQGEVAVPDVPDTVSEAQAAVARNLEIYHRVADRRRAATTHPDDAAIDCFAGEALKPKMAEGRAKGRSGWETCPPEVLSRMLREHVEKGDPRDVALFCMMLWSMGARIVAAPQPDVQAEVPQAIRLRFFRDLIDAERIKFFKVFGVLPDGAESQAETHAVQGMLLKHLWRSIQAPQPEAQPRIPFAGYDPKFCTGSNPDNPQPWPDDEAQPTEAAHPVNTTAENWLRTKYGAYRGHPEWRALEAAFNAGMAAQMGAA